jgi:hypothetical protein
LNPKDERDYIRILKEIFGKALEPYKRVRVRVTELKKTWQGLY